MAPKDSLEFPRIIYRGKDWTGEPGPDSECRRVESAEDFADASKAGWRLTPDNPKVVDDGAGKIEKPAPKGKDADKGKEADKGAADQKV